jgi:hypothetical protein
MEPTRVLCGITSYGVRLQHLKGLNSIRAVVVQENCIETRRREAMSSTDRCPGEILKAVEEDLAQVMKAGGV